MKTPDKRFRDIPGVYSGVPPTQFMKTQEECPQEVVESFIWWALAFSPSREDDKCPGCGENIINRLKPEYLHHTALTRIKTECQKFWEGARSSVETSFGRTNVAPSVDTLDFHIRGVGCGFFWARFFCNFGFQDWPTEEQDKLMLLASGFTPAFLQKQEDGFLHLVEDPENKWFQEHEKMTQAK